MGLLILQLLKWILWIILFLVLFFLLILLLALLVPIRYRAKGEYKEGRMRIQGKVGWLFSFVSFSFAYEEEFRAKLRILGISFFDSKKPKGKAVEVKEEKLKTASTPPKEKGKRKKTDKRGASDEPIPLEEKAASSASSSASPEEVAQSTALPQADTMDSSDRTEEEAPTEGITPRPSFLDKLKKIGEKLKELKAALLRFWDRLKGIWQSWQDKKALFDHYHGLWKREDTQITWKRARHKFGKMVRSIAPRRWLLSGRIGLDDPSATGQMMAGLGIAYPFLGNHIQITPDFERQAMELKGFLKGRIILGVLLYQLVTLLLNRNCIAFIKMIVKEIMGDKNNEDSNNKQEVADDRQ